MAELVATIVGISTSAVKLTDTLYKFGSNVSDAREQTSRISQRVIDFTTVLDILTTTIEGEADFVSDKANLMIQKLCDQSTDLFHDIEDHLPRRGENNGRDSLSFRAKILWTFRRSRVELLLGQLEYVKSNVLLIVMTTRVGRKLRSRRYVSLVQRSLDIAIIAIRECRSKSKQTADQDVENLQHERLKACNAIVQHINAGERLEELKNKAVKADEVDLASSPNADALVKVNTDTAVAIISIQAEAIVKFQSAMLGIANPASRQVFVMYNSSPLLEDLLLQWTKPYPM
ncbi:MAG: hypothetical protein Q9160_001317 [Pyrenula sp. 1 TL-2023]